MDHLPVPVAPAEVQDNDALGHLPQALADALKAAAELRRSDKSDSTRRGYASGFADFASWCSRFGLCPLPAHEGAVAAYLAHLVDRKLKASTISHRVAAIAAAHRGVNLDSPTTTPTVRSVVKGIKRRLGTRPVKKAPLTDNLVVKAIRRIRTDTLIGLRDRAIILVAFVSALRRSELVGLDVEHLERRPDGIMLHLARSKGDQEGKGQTVAVPNGTKLRAVEALDAWTKAAGITFGPVFRGVGKGGRALPGRLCDRQFARIVKAAAKRIGLNADLFSGHSTRSGFVTTAGSRGADLAKTAKHLRHAKLDTTLGYFQPEDAFASHAGRGFL